MPLFVTEFKAMAQIPGAQMPDEASKQAAYEITIGGASVQSPTFQPGTRFIELHCDAPCSIDIGLNPVAVGTARRMAANQTMFRGVPENGGYKVAVITNS